MKILKTLRSIDWWEPKIIPLLSIGYLTILLHAENIWDHFGWLLFLILAISVGAIYVSILNDFTDLKFDMASGKTNRLERFSAKNRKFILLASIVLAVLFCLFFINDMLSLWLYLAAYISFSLYSIMPFRFKDRGILGVIADASGAHLFPSLLIVSSTSFRLGVEIDIYWFIIIGIWSFAYGLRGILWHQFWDKESDLSINIKTFATSTDTSLMKPIEYIITAVELSALLLILFYILEPLPLVALLFYFLTLIGYKKLKIQSVMILAPNGAYHILMNEFYLVLLPLSLIATCSIKSPLCWLLIVFHVLLFPSNTKLFIKHILWMLNLKKR
jgi:4-hydroxybenzoate polyprenyltransferase